MTSYVVTGASTGIGRAAVEVLVEQGFQVFGSVRKTEDAERLTADLGKSFTPLVFDVLDENAILQAAQRVREKLGGQRLSGLVNNAGVAIPGPMLYQPVEEFWRQVEVNLKGPLLVTRAFAPLLGTDRSLAGRPGRIVNISSIGGKLAAPFIGAYAASKFGLEGLSESLRRELLPFGIDVIVIGPGSINTPIWEKSAASADLHRYDDTPYAVPLRKFRDYAFRAAAKGFPPRRAGEFIARVLAEPKPRVRYALIPGRLANWTIPMLLPKRVVDRAIGKQMGLLANVE